MMLAGTTDGVYRLSGIDGAAEFGAERVLDASEARRVERLPGVGGVFAATVDGLYHSLDGDDWTALGVPGEVYSVAADPAGDRLYAGTHPSHVYVAEGFSAGTDPEWRELDGFQNLPSRDDWHTPRHRNESHVRSLHIHPDAPDRVIAGVEVGGVHVSDDRGETWTEQKEGVHDDIHHLLVRAPDEYVASTGYGLYRTRDAGRSWTRLDEGVEQRYFREAMDHDGVLYAAAASGSPNTWPDGAAAAIFEARDGDRLEAVGSGDRDDVVLSWAVADGTVYAGTSAERLLRRDDDGWQPVGELPVDGRGVRSLCVGGDA
jgi:photosystem II stability/assembly factor-like uncharacterized protein